MRKSFTRLFSLFALFCVLGLQMVYGGVIDRVPADGATNVKPSTDLTLSFDYPLAKGDNYTGAVIELRKTVGGSTIDAITLPSSRFVIDGSKVTIDLQATLSDLTDFYVVIPDKVLKETKPDGTSVNFTGFSASTDWNFVTGDYTAPVVASSNPFSPVDGATNVGSSLASGNVKTSAFSITFNEAVKGVSGKYIKIYTAAGNIHEMIDAGTYTSSSAIVNFSTVNLREKSDYYILVDAGAFIDGNKNEFAGISDKTKFNFTTRDYTPAVVAANYPIKANVTNTSFGLKIKLDEPAIVYYLVLPKAAADALTSMPTVGDVVSGAQSVDVTTANTETSKTIDKYWNGTSLTSIPTSASSADYVVYYCSKNKSKVLTPDDFLTSDVAKLGDPISSLDDSAPLVIGGGLVPAVGATNVAQYLDGGTDSNHGSFSITFNESVKAGSGNIILKKSSDNSVVESVDITGSSVSFKDATGASGTNVTDKVVVKFATKLQSTTKYYVTIASGVITDLTGNKYAGIATSTAWSFTTSDLVAPTVTFSTPASKGVLGVSETVVLTFSEDVVFASTDAASVRVEKDNNPVTSTANYNSTTKKLTISVAWTQNSTYVVKLLKNQVKDLSNNFITTEIKKAYNTDSYDVPSVTDTTNVAITGTSVNIGASDNIVIRFSEPVELLGGGAITNDNVGSLITLNENGGGAVSFVATYDPSTRNVTINPVSDLGNAKSYTLNVSTGYEDLNLIGGANQGLGATVTYKVGDTVSPAITYNFTKTNVPTVAANASIVVRFSKAIFNSTGGALTASELVSYSTLRLGDANGPIVPLSSTVAVSGNDYTFKPANDLQEGKTYYFSFANGVVFDNASPRNANVGASTTFVTKTTPELASSVPADGAEDVDNNLSQIVLNFSENVKMSTSYVAPGSGPLAAGPIVVVVKGTNTVVANTTTSAADLAFVGTSLTAVLHITTPLVTEGEYEVLVDGNFIYNASNNAAAAIGAGDLSFKVKDFAAPTLATTGALTATAITDAAKMTDPIKIKFSEKVKKGIGTIAIQRVLPSVLPQEAIDVNSSTVSISDDGLTVSVNHSAFTPCSSSIVAYKVTVTNGAITDLAGNKFAGLLDDGTTVPSTVITSAAQNYTAIATGSGKQWLFSTAQNVAPVFDVNASTPFDGSDKVSTATNIVIAFNEAISLVPTTGGAKKVTLHTTTTGGVAQEYRMNESNVSISGKTITVTLTAAGLAANTQYYISLEAGAVQDIYGAANAAIGWTVGTPDVMNGNWDFNTGDSNAPVPTVVVNGTKNSSGAWEKVKRNSDIVINFDEPIRLANSSNSAITSADIPQGIVTLSSTGNIPSYTADISSDKKTITINASSFTANLTSVTDYTIVVSGVEDSNDHLIGTNSFTFKVDDYDAPAGVYTGKGLNVIDNTKGTEVKVEFDYNENATTYYQLLAATASAPTVASLKANGTAVSVDKDADPATSVVIPTAEGTTYKLYAVAYDVVNATPQAAVEVYDIQTADVTAPTVVEYVNNGKANVDPATSFDITLKFADKVDQGAGSAYIFNSSDVLVATIPVSSADFSVDKQVKITVASGLVSNQSYYLVVDKGFATDLNPGTLPSPNVGTPTKTVNKYAGFSDKVTYTFKTKDTNAPTVSAVTPRTTAAGTNVASAIAAVNADINSNIVVTFNEDILLGSNAGIGNIEILKPGGALLELIIPNSGQVSISGKVLTINPGVDFVDGLAGYTVNIKAGSVKDAAGKDNAVASWTFDVKDMAAPTVSFKANTTTGDKITEKAVAVTDDIFVGFSETVRLLDNSAFITDDLDSLVTLVDAANVKVPFTSATANTSSFVINPVNPLKSDATYTLSFGQVFEDGANNAVPAQSVTFKTKLSNSPTVMFDPKNGTNDVDASKTITITFGRSIVQEDPSGTAATGYFSTLEDSELKDYITLKVGSADVAFKATINAIKKVITIDPVVDFDSEAVVDLTFDPYGIGNSVQGSISDLVDSLNNAVIVASADYKSLVGTHGGLIEFTVTDKKAPVLAGTKYSPNEANYLNAGDKLSAQFSEKVKAGTGDIKIYRKDGTLVETIDASTLATKSDDETTILINPVKARENNTEYYVIIPSGAIVDKSPLANAFAGTVDYTSWTYSTADNQTPVVVSLSPASGSKDVYVYDNLVLTFDKKVKLGSGNIAIYKKGGDAFDLLRVSTSEYRVKMDPSQLSVTIDFTNTLAPETEYYVEVEPGTFVNAKNTNAKFAGLMANTDWTFSTEVTNAPKVIANGLTPADNSTINTDKLVLSMTFDREVMKGTGVVKLIETAAGTVVETVNIADAVVAGTNASITFLNPLKSGTDYHVIVEAGTVTNTLPSKVAYAGITSPAIWNFTTSTDITAPKLVTWTPNATTTTDNDPTYVMTFDENVVLGAGSLKIYKKSDNSLALTIPVTATMVNDKVVTVKNTYDATLNNGLDKNTDYYVLVDAGLVKDAAGNPSAAVTDVAAWTFKTGADYVTGIDNPIDNSLAFKVYPNPFESGQEVTVETSFDLTKVVVTNIAGQVVKQVVNPTGTIQLNELRSGVYFMALYQGNKVAATVKIVKR